MHIGPALQRWAMRFGLATMVAIAIGYVPNQIARRDPRVAKLNVQIDQLDIEARELAVGNAVLFREIDALRSDVGAIENRARADLGMVYPDEVVLQVRRGDE